jgi:hypothetical protein
VELDDAISFFTNISMNKQLASLYPCKILNSMLREYNSFLILRFFGGGKVWNSGPKSSKENLPQAHHHKCLSIKKQYATK